MIDKVYQGGEDVAYGRCHFDRPIYSRLFFGSVNISVIIDYFIFTELKNCFIYFFFVNLLSKGFE